MDIVYLLYTSVISLMIFGQSTITTRAFDGFFVQRLDDVDAVVVVVNDVVNVLPEFVL
jgi:hypothetical protein